MKAYAVQGWIGTGAQIAGALILASKVAPPVVAYPVMLIGSCLWLFIAVRRSDWPLGALNLAFTAINVVGLIAWGVGQ